MKLTKKQRITLEFLAEVGPVTCLTIRARRVLVAMKNKGLVYANGGFVVTWHITRKGREALKEAQGK